MKRWLGCLLAFSLLFALLPVSGLAAELTLEVPSEVNSGATLTMTGTAPGNDVMISIRNADGEILFFDTQKVVSGSYRAAITVPDAWQGSTYRVAVVSAKAEVVKNVSVRRPNRSSGGYTGSLPSGPSTSPDPVLSAGPRGVAVTLETANADGKWTAAMTADQVKQALELLKNDSGDQGAELVVRLKAEGEGSADAGEMVLQLPSAAAELLWNGAIDSLVMDTPLGSLAFDRKSMQALQNKNGGDIRFAIAKAESGSLPSGAQALVGAHPAVSLSVAIGDTTVGDLGGGTIRLGIPYAHSAAEDPHAVVVYSILAEGAPAVVRNGFYDTAEGIMYVAVKRFSLYGVGVNKVPFADVSGWSTDYITYLAARGIINGIGVQQFAPVQSVTRAEFLAILARMSEEGVSDYTNGLFTDVQADDWYAPYIQWGYRNSVVNGTGDGKFNPNGRITREEMAVMLSRYTAYAAYTLPKVKEPAAFADQAQFSSWAEKEIGELQQAGLIDGIGGNRFNPGGTATREEAAKLIAVLLQGMSR